MKTLILTRRQIEPLINLKKAIAAVEEVFAEHAKGKAQMPAKIYLDLKKFNGDFRAMPAYVEKLNASTLKWVNSHPGNKKYNLPAVMAVLILSDPKNGFPLCIMDGTHATNIRTGAAGAVAAKYLAKKNSKVISLVGCGKQALNQLVAIDQIFKLEKIKVWGHADSYIKLFLKQAKKFRKRIQVCKTIKECVDGGDIVVTTTPSRKPIVKLEWLASGAHINAIGADAAGKQELDSLILKNAKVVIDNWAQASHSGEINVPLRKKQISKKNIYAELGELIIGKKKTAGLREGLTVFDSTGLAIQDTAIANLIYKSARRMKIGKYLSFI